MPLGVEQVVRGLVSRARRGLYGGRTILSGNKVSEDGKNKCGPFFACATSQSNGGSLESCLCRPRWYMRNKVPPAACTNQPALLGVDTSRATSGPS